LPRLQKEGTWLITRRSFPEHSSPSCCEGVVGVTLPVIIIVAEGVVVGEGVGDVDFVGKGKGERGGEGETLDEGGEVEGLGEGKGKGEGLGEGDGEGDGVARLTVIVKLARLMLEAYGLA